MKALHDWLDACHARLSQLPDPARHPLLFAGQAIGSAHAQLWPQLAPHWPLQGDLSEGLARLAQHLRQQGRSGPWRDECVAVKNAQGDVLGAIERGVVRVLGVATEAVHLVGITPDGRVWLQQRAFDKANDPGRWDTLMGGMVAHGESLQDTLLRETWEEAGLRLGQLQGLRWGGSFAMCKPSDDAGGLGQLIETIHWCVATVPEGVEPRNLDGEVECFEALAGDEVARRVLDGACTDEAAWVLALALGWISPVRR